MDGAVWSTDLGERKKVNPRIPGLVCGAWMIGSDGGRRLAVVDYGVRSVEDVTVNGPPVLSPGPVENGCAGERERLASGIFWAGMVVFAAAAAMPGVC